MEKTLRIFLILGVAMTFVYFATAQHTYIGVDKCKVCHKSEAKGNQYGKWLDSKHSKAYQSIANLSESKKCMPCHSPYGQSAPAFKADGVGCEACHGPGSDYKAMHIMKDRNLARQNGLIIYPNEDAIKNLCLKCHKKENPYHRVRDFDFATAWKSISHYYPK